MTDETTPPAPDFASPEFTIAHQSRHQASPVYFERSLLSLIELHRRQFDMTDERFMIALLGFLQSWTQLLPVRQKCLAALAAARAAAAQDLKREDKTLTDPEIVAQVIAALMEVRL